MIDKRFFPNFITILNLLSGVLSISFLLQGRILYASIMIFFGTVFDFFDGTVARMLKVSNPIGKDLDSLADVVTFGVAPGLLVFSMIKNPVLKYFSFLLAAFAALRLARFNNDSGQKFVFKGLPTPAMAIFFASIVLSIKYQHVSWLDNDLVLVVLAVVFSFLMVVNLPMIAFKFKNFRSFMQNKIKLIFLLSSLVLIILFGFLGISLSVIFYIFLSILSPEEY